VGRKKCGWGTSFQGFEVLADAVLTVAASFFFVFPAAGLVGAADNGLGFLAPGVLLVAVTLVCEGVSVTDLVVGLGFGVGVVVALTTRPLERRGFSPLPDPSACQWAKTAGL